MDRMVESRERRRRGEGGRKDILSPISGQGSLSFIEDEELFCRDALK